MSDLQLLRPDPEEDKPVKFNPQEMITSEFENQKESVHRVEFILWKNHIVCNVEINGVWRTCAVPNNITLEQFMLSGEMEKMNGWILGRYYKHC